MILIREIKKLLYEQGYTIGGARQKMSDGPKTTNKPSVESGEIKSLIKDLEQVISKM